MSAPNVSDQNTGSAPTSLFHYQPYVLEHLEGLILGQKIRFSQPLAFNDPWDSRPHWRAPKDENEMRRLKDFLFKSYRDRNLSASDARLALMIYNVTKNEASIHDFLYKHEKKMAEDINQTYRIYALSEKFDSILMWSHYAKGHTGVCLEFGTSLAPFTKAERVEYLDEYPALEMASEGYRALFSKAACWSYEKEWRIIGEETKFAKSNESIKTVENFCDLKNNSLKSITVGCLATPQVKIELNEMIVKSGLNIILRLAETDTENFSMNFNPPFD